MLIIWSGKGILVPLFVVVAFFLCMFIVTPLHLQGGLQSAAAVSLAGVVAGAALFFTTRAIESKEGRVFIDAATNERFTVRPNAGSFFFIPTRYWSYIVAVLGVAIAVAAMIDPAATASQF